MPRSPRPKRGPGVGTTKRGKDTKLLVVVDGEGVPLGGHFHTASPAEVTLAEADLASVQIPRPRDRPRTKPDRLIADKAYDSDALRRRLRGRGIDVIVPHRRNRRRPPVHDGRKLRRYRRRWIVERTIAWIGNFRRLLVRWEGRLTMYAAFLHVAFIMLALRRVTL